jgi:small basic protein
MVAVFVGLLIGIFVGFMYPAYVPSQLSQYVAVAILAALDSVVGAISANLNKNFSFKVFISGFFVNAALAAFLTYIGKGLDLDLYLAAVVVFGTRLFQNLAKIRRSLLKLPTKKDTIV